MNVHCVFHNPAKGDRREREVVLVFGKSIFGGFARNYFVRGKPNGYSRGRKINSERYTFTGELLTGLGPATSPKSFLF